MAKGITVGLDKIFYAVMNDDETYQAPKAIPGAIQATVTPTTNSTTLYADDKAYEVATSLGDIEFSLNVADLPSDIYAEVLGHSIDSNGVVVRSSTDNAPYVAVGYRRRKSNGKYRYVWMYKGKFQPDEQTAQTKGDTPAFQTPTIAATFVPREADGQWQATVNEDDIGVLPSVVTNWFVNVYLSTNDSTAPTITATVPVAAATGVAVGSTLKWTFSKAIRPGDVTADRFILQKADGSAVVSGLLTLNTAGTEVSFKPTGNLAAATEYMALVTGVKDISGNVLAVPKVTTFTTA